MIKGTHKIGRATRTLKVVANLPLVLLAILWRRTALRGVTVIAITGSVGKTTATKCLAAILSKMGPTKAAERGSNGRFGIPQLLLRTRRSHRYLVAEVGIIKPGRMWRSAFTVNPDVTVVTKINWQHAKNFESLEQIAWEKARLMEPLGAKGLAVLNADDPHVMSMAEGLKCKIRTFGVAKEADIRATAVKSQWPDRLALNVVEGDEQRLIQTRLVGSHWSVSVLAAVTAARSLGASWEQCEQGLAELPPFPARLSSVRLPTGADLLRDEYNGSFATFVEAAEVLRLARAKRTILVVGHILDAPDLGDKAHEEVGKRAAESADLLLFWGSYAERYRKAAVAAGVPAEAVHVFKEQLDLADFLRRESRPGDLVLLKGYWFDHMSRIVYRQFGTVSCQLSYCERTGVCDHCPHMGLRSERELDPTLAEAQKQMGRA